MAAKLRKEVHLTLGPEEPPGRMREEDAETIPYADFNILVKQAIEDAVRVAWRRLPVAAERQHVDLMQAQEPRITRLLRDELEELRCDEDKPVPDFNEDLISYIPENEDVPDCSGAPSEDPTKKPDLVFRPVKKPRQVVRLATYGLFVECKILENGRHKIGDYCSKGLMRFVKGHYARMMPSGLMIAYVRDGNQIESSLAPHLQMEEHKKTYEVKSLPSICKRRHARIPLVYLSLHGRSLVAVGERPSGDIEIAHLWLHVA